MPQIAHERNKLMTATIYTGTAHAAGMLHGFQAQSAAKRTGTNILLHDAGNIGANNYTITPAVDLNLSLPSCVHISQNSQLLQCLVL